MVSRRKRFISVAPCAGGEVDQGRTLSLRLRTPLVNQVGFNHLRLAGLAVRRREGGGRRHGSTGVFFGWGCSERGGEAWDPRTKCHKNGRGSRGKGAAGFPFPHVPFED